MCSEGFGTTPLFGHPEENWPNSAYSTPYPSNLQTVPVVNHLKFEGLVNIHLPRV